MKNLRRTARRSLALGRLLGVPQSLRLLRRHGGRVADAVQVAVPGTPDGLWLRPAGSDPDVLLQMFGARDYDLSWCPPYHAHLRRLLAEIEASGRTPLIIDAGANIGASTLWFALNYPTCRIYAVEPDPGNFAMLERNLADQPQVTLFHAGVWDSHVSLALKSDHDDSWGRRVQAQPAAGIPSVTIPELLAHERDLQPLIVKIDIEGAEVALLRSNTAWIDDVPLVIFEPHDNLWHWLGTWQGTGHAFFAALTRVKREYLLRGENVFAFLHPNDPA